MLLLIFAACDGGSESGDGSTDGGGAVLDEPLTGPTADPPSGPAPPDPGSDEPLNNFQASMLELVNEARAQSRNCGGDFFPAAPPVNWDIRIENAAVKHSTDMAQMRDLTHIGSEGSDPGDRLLTEGYDWFTFGENILVGLDNGANVIDNWLNSQGHCSIIMNPIFEEVGVGAAEGVFQGNATTYWTLDLATENN